MRLSGEISLGDIANVLLLLPTAAALFLTWLQLKRNNETQQAIFFRELYASMFADPEMREAFDVLESKELKYEEGYHRTKAGRVPIAVEKSSRGWERGRETRVELRFRG